jgi:hypothetical protein
MSDKNKETTLKDAKQDGKLLQKTSKQLQNDKDIVMEADKQHRIFLRYASKEL